MWIPRDKEILEKSLKKEYSERKIIIFGGSGFIGSNLINKIKNLNYDITSVSRKKILNKKKYRNIRYISCDVSNFQKFKRSNQIMIILLI